MERMHIASSGTEDFVSSRLHNDNLSLRRMFQAFPFNSAGGRPRCAGSFVVVSFNEHHPSRFISTSNFYFKYQEMLFMVRLQVKVSRRSRASPGSRKSHVGFMCY